MSADKRRPSFPSQSSEAILSTTDQPLAPSALVKHGKYVLVGAVGSWWVGIVPAVQGVYGGVGGWVRNVLILALICHALTVAIFLYLVVFLPYVRGYVPNYPKWQESKRMQVIVPALTLSILIGWSSYVISLSQAGKRSILTAVSDAVKSVGQADLGKITGGQGLGLFSSLIGATSVFVLTLGVLGFIPAPRNAAIRKKAT